MKIVIINKQKVNVLLLWVKKGVIMLVRIMGKIIKYIAYIDEKNEVRCFSKFALNRRHHGLVINENLHFGMMIKYHPIHISKIQMTKCPNVEINLLFPVGYFNPVLDPRLLFMLNLKYH